MRILCVCTLLAALIAGGCATGKSESSSSRAGYDFSKMDKIAIVAVEGAVRSEAAKNQIAEFFSMELLKKGYAPISRTQVKALLTGQVLSPAELTTIEAAPKAGKILKVPAVLIVNVPHFGEDISISAAMIDVEDGSSLWEGIGTGTTGGGGFMSNLFGGGNEAGAVAGGEQGQVISGIVGGQLGLAEQPLTPREAKNVQKIVTKICKSLPPHAGLKNVEGRCKFLPF
jgi:hypothetical protein